MSAHHELGPAGPLLLAGLAFGLGSGIVRDPAYPWIARTLASESFGERERRVVRLHRRVSIYARHVILSLTVADDAEG